jgi:hypothetical protein
VARVCNTWCTMLWAEWMKLAPSAPLPVQKKKYISDHTCIAQLSKVQRQKCRRAYQE